MMLSPVERRIVQGLADGYALPDWCRETDYNLHTAKTLVHRAKLKLGARTHAELVAAALRQGLVE